MKKIRFLFLFIAGIIVHSYAQVGINTESPTGIFHIHTGTTSSTDNDVVVLKNGNVGIGTVNPQNKLEIVAPVGHPNTGLRLPGATAGQSLVAADATGNIKWDNIGVQYQTVVRSSLWGPVSTPDLRTQYNPSGLQAFKLTDLDYLQVDNVASVFPGSGWDITKSEYLVPRTGYYRISLSVYFLSNIPANTIGPYNNRVYIFRTKRINASTPGDPSLAAFPGDSFLDAGLVSVTDAGSDVIGYTSGIGYLEQNDIIDVRLVCQTAGIYNAGTLNGQWVTSHIIKYWKGTTYAVIELLSTI